MTISVEDFVELFKNKKKEDYFTIGARYYSNNVLVKRLIEILESNQESSVCDSVTEILYILLSHGNNDSEIFCMNFIPSIIWLFYYQIATKQKIQCSSKVDAVLLHIYNKAVDVNNEETNIFHVPLLTKSSIFHEAGSIQTSSGSSLTEHSLSQHNAVNEPIRIKGPTTHIDRIPAGLRSLVVKTVLNEYNSQISYVTEHSLKALCNLVVRLSAAGYRFDNLVYNKLSDDQFSELSRYSKIKLHSIVIEQLVIGLHFSIYNGQAVIGKSALSFLQKRSCSSISYKGLMNCNALQDLSGLSTKREDYFRLPVLIADQMKYRAPKENKPLEERRPTIIRTAKVNSSLVSPTNNTSSPLIRLSEVDMKLEDDDYENSTENIPLKILTKNNDDDDDDDDDSANPDVTVNSSLNNVQIPLENDDPKNQLTAIQENYDKSSDKVPLIVSSEENSSSESEPNVVIKETGSVTLLSHKSNLNNYNLEKQIIELKT